ncbi:MAG: GNAT family N-acetyltransferase [Pseudomonadota bacterium]
MIPTLQTDRLTLRAPRWEDFDAYAAFCASPRTIHLGGPFGRNDAFQKLCAILGHWHLRGYGRWMVADRKTDEPLGILGLYYPEGWPERELAWSLFDTAEGRGIAYEAAIAARDYAYDKLGWTTLISAIERKNTRSVALARRLGCTEGALFQHAIYGDLRLWRHPAPEERA